MKKRQKQLAAYVVMALCISPLAAKAHTKPEAQDPSWVAKSNRYTALLMNLDKKYSPEHWSAEGAAPYDSEISVPSPANQATQRKEKQLLLNSYIASLRTEQDLAVKHDLNILINNIQLDLRRHDFEKEHIVPFMNAAAMMYGGLSVLLNDEIPAARRDAAVIRMRKYAGMEKGYRPYATLLRERTARQIAGKDMVYPPVQQIEAGLSRNAILIGRIETLCKEYKLSGWEEPYQKIKAQVAEYDLWVRQHVLVKARQDARLPPEEYALALEASGIDIPPAELAASAHAAFTSIQHDMQQIAKQIAEQRHLPSADYRDVIAELKKEQIHGDAILPLYEGHLKEIEEIIRKQQQLTLPDQPAIVRMASAAETAKMPAPSIVPPSFLNNTGQRAQFILPFNPPVAPGGKETIKYDDFTFDAISWDLIAHEARPGHDLQIDKLIDNKMSQARYQYAANSTNVEGWGMYARYIIAPYIPLEGQLMSLDQRLLSAASAFLEVELQAGKVTQQQAVEILTNDVVLSKGFAQKQAAGYLSITPEQSNAGYFHGFSKLIDLRKETAATLGNQFNVRRFHDFILAQGLLPPALIRDAVMKEFVPSEKNK
ncbi:DUF885 family protein [Janthinobacterium agaricidamnosum]|nr:DUF885 family protein [Janthinobacterium agaricidamnosum]